MKLIIFGATGTLGRHIVEQALAQGDKVSAFARDPSVLNMTHQDLHPVAGDVLDRRLVADAVKDHDAVLISLGAGLRGGVRSVGTQNVIDAMKQHGVKRLVCLSTLACRHLAPGTATAISIFSGSTSCLVCYSKRPWQTTKHRKHSSNKVCSTGL